MSQSGNRGKSSIGISLVVSLAMAASVMFFTGNSPATSATSGGAGAATSSFTRVAQSPQGFARSKIVGQTHQGQRVTGYFTPLRVSKHNGHLRVKGLVHGVVHRGAGKSRTFDAVRTLRVKSMNGTVPGSASKAAGAGAARSCDILNLVLAPLDLDLLGLKVHLDKVVLNIVAQSGAGQLLGNLLCAVAGLLDGGGTLSQLLNRLGQILDALLMGV